MNKRYSIVRVDDDYKHICPSAFEKVDDSSFCKLAKRKGGSCNVCPYGDTKEQLIRKVATVLRRILKVDVCSYKYKGKMRKLETIRFKGKGRFDEIVIELEEVATKIVEFLGVEE